ncbi:peptidase S1 domain-containing protein [Nephila pilipes]|uniref:Peptidase S1 domain-containing protein n=1 Tax=Nephila pilipes TaxID=299642 RepID=A0A8X6TFN8_NEPPI|nr:peptidase S1 domain-containing protein [Nephila pilipes]GFT10042.1 peptidase S1 domain-containing protein [Nephila pilipes]
MQTVKTKICEPLPECFRSNKSTVMCATGTHLRQRPCKGDSGATAFWDVENGRAYVGLGVTSFPKEEKCEPSKPITYISIFPYMDWIKMYVKNLPKPYEDYARLKDLSTTHWQRNTGL